jgi:uncharacterized protein
MKKMPFLTTSFFVGIVTLFLSQTVFAGDAAKPFISIIIDDIGYRMREDLRAMALPGPVAFAIMPHSPHARQMSELANEKGKDVLLHLPMQAMEEEKNKFLGPGALTLQMTHKEFIRTLNNSLRSVPYAIGVNNHMGSLLTRHPGHMRWLMESLKNRNKFYIDSVTSSDSVAGNVAREMHLPFLRRDVFLDNVQSDKDIQKQFDELINIAKRKGVAIAIGHPHPRTVAVLSRELLHLDKYGVTLISPKEMLKHRNAKASYQRVSLSKKTIGDRLKSVP